MSKVASLKVCGLTAPTSRPVLASGGMHGHTKLPLDLDALLFKWLHHLALADGQATFKQPACDEPGYAAAADESNVVGVGAHGVNSRNSKAKTAWFPRGGADVVVADQQQAAVAVCQN